MPYTRITAVTGIIPSPVLLDPLLTVPKLVVTLQNLVPGKAHWVRAGYVQAVNMTNIGEVCSKPQAVNFGPTEIEFEPPAYPYQLRFSPLRYVKRWTLELSTKDRSGSDGIPSVPLSEASSTDTGWVIW